MSPQMGVVTDVDLAAAVAAEAALRLAADLAEAAARLAADNAHLALTVTHGTVDDIADQTDIENHRLDPDAHHSEEIPEGRAIMGATTFLVIPGEQSGSVMGTGGYTLNRIYYFPLDVRTPITIDGVVIEVTAAAGAGERCRIAIYEADINWQPGDLVVASAEIAIDAVAVVTTALAATTLQEGRYLAALNCEGTITMRTIKRSRVIGFKPTLGATAYIFQVYVAAAYGALPDPGTFWDVRVDAAEGWHTPIWLNVVTP